MYNVRNHLCSKIQLSTLIKKVQRTPMSSKSWSGVVEDSGGSWLGFWFLTMMGNGQQCPKWSLLQISTVYNEFKGEKNPQVLRVLIGVVVDSGGSWLGFWFLMMMGMGQQCPNWPMFRIPALNGQRSLMSLKSWTGDLEDPGGSWLGFWFLIMMGMGPRCTKLPMFRNSAFYIE